MLSGIAGLAGIIGLLVLSLVNEYQDETQHARTEVENISQVLDEHASAIVHKGDLLLREVQRNVRSEDMRPAHGVRGIRKQALHDLLKSQLDSAPEVSVIHIANAKGDYIYSSLDPIPGINIADRDYFNHQRASTTAGLLISSPLISRTTGKWTIVLSRRLNYEDDSFAGLVSVILNLDYFQQFYRTLNLGPQGVVALYDQEFHLAARYPPNENLMGKVVPVSVGIYIEKGIKHGVYPTKSPVDGIERQISYRQLNDLPLFVFAGISEQDYLALWHRHIWQYSAGAIVFGLVVISFGLRQRRSEKALRKSDDDLRTIADYTYDWEYWEGLQGELLYISPSCQRITGYSQAEFIADPHLIYDIIHAEDQPLMDAHRADIQHEDVGTLDFRILTKEGETRWIAHGCREVYSKDGHFNGRRTSNRDITDRKALEEAELRERDFAESLIDTAQAIVILLDTEGRIVRLNHYMEELSGYRLEEVKGASWFATFLPEQDKDAILGLFKKALTETHTQANINPILARDGRKILVEWYDKTLKDTAGNIIGLLAIGQDVTLREKLAESQRLLKAAVEQSNSSIVVTDSDGTIIFVNAGFAHTSGYSGDEAIGQNPRILKSGKMQKETYEEIWATITSGRHWSGELCNKKKNGDLYWETANISPITDEGGRITHYLAVKDDITRRKQAETALQEQKNFLSAILENEPECVMVVSADEVVLQMNAAGFIMLEVNSVEEVNAFGLVNFVEADHRAAFLNLARRVFDGESGVLEFQVEGRKGARRWLETHATPLRDAAGKITFLLGVTRDVTRRREAEERLALSLRGSNQAMTDWHIPSDTLTFGEGWMSLLGYQPDELSSNSSTLFELMRPEDAPAAHDALIRHLKGETSYLESEIRMRHKDGRWIWVLARGMAVERTSDGRVVRVAGTAMDITARKKAEAEIARLSQWNELLLNSAGEGIYGVDHEGHCTFINPAALAILGFAKHELIGKSPHPMFHHHHTDGSPYHQEDCPIFMTLRDGIRREVEDAFIRKNGEAFPVQLTVTPMHDNGLLVGVEVVFQDIALRKKMEQELMRLATTDPLTGMANRRHFLEQLKMELAHFKRFGRPATFLMVDIDHFKNVNDTYGHAVGDVVLQHFGELSKLRLRRIDLIGRLGGEEFGILLPGTDITGALQFAERFRIYVADTPAQSANGTIPFTISIGISGFDQKDVEPDGILARADAALYLAKASGRNQTKVS